MRSRNQPSLELLEGKALLSGVTPGLAATLTVTPDVTTTGSTVSFTFTEKNVSQHELTVDLGPVDDGFAIRQGGKTIWLSNPGILPQFLEADQLTPGQSITLKGTWDGRANIGSQDVSGEHGPQLTGDFTISNELDGTASTFRLVHSFESTHVVPPKPPAHWKA